MSVCPMCSAPLLPTVHGAVCRERCGYVERAEDRESVAELMDGNKRVRSVRDDLERATEGDLPQARLRDLGLDAGEVVGVLSARLDDLAGRAMRALKRVK